MHKYPRENKTYTETVCTSNYNPLPFSQWMPIATTSSLPHPEFQPRATQTVTCRITLASTANSHKNRRKDHHQNVKSQHKMKFMIISTQMMLSKSSIKFSGRLGVHSKMPFPSLYFDLDLCVRQLTLYLTCQFLALPVQ